MFLCEVLSKSNTAQFLRSTSRGAGVRPGQQSPGLEWFLLHRLCFHFPDLVAQICSWWLGLLSCTQQTNNKQRQPADTWRHLQQKCTVRELFAPRGKPGWVGIRSTHRERERQDVCRRGKGLRLNKNILGNFPFFSTGREGILLGAGIPFAGAGSPDSRPFTKRSQYLGRSCCRF